MTQQDPRQPTSASTFRDQSVMADVYYTRSGVREIVIHLPGGKLTMYEYDEQPPPTETAEPVPVRVTKREFTYSGYLPREMGLELVRRAPDHGGTIAGKSLLDWLGDL